MAKVKATPRTRRRRGGGGAARAKAPKSEVRLFTLSTLKPPRGSHRARIRKGRGPGSGIGTTADRGGKGQTARTGGQPPPSIEGGPMTQLRLRRTPARPTNAKPKSPRPAGSGTPAAGTSRLPTLSTVDPAVEP